MPPKKKEKGAAAAKAALNLSVLQRVDPQITRIEASTAHATLYKLENGTVRRGAIFGGLLSPCHTVLSMLPRPSMECGFSASCTSRRG
eukprot:m.158128 g.158128  ORF g.158128 m.158128 type:complete len:88 (-) comp23684_c0_seq1:1498-1761(-)